MTGLGIASGYTTRITAQMSYSSIGRICFATGVVMSVSAVLGLVGSESSSIDTNHSYKYSRFNNEQLVKKARLLFRSMVNKIVLISLISIVAFRGRANSDLLEREFSTSSVPFSLKLGFKVFGFSALLELFRPF